MYSSSSSSSGSSLDAPVTLPSYPNLLPYAASRFEITVTDPEQRGDGIQRYVCYKVSSSFEYEEGTGQSATQSCVIRRFSDFVWLHDTLESELKSLLIPHLPDKSLMGRFVPEFVEERRRALQLFLNRLMEHEVIKRHTYVHIFLTGTDDDLNRIRSKGEESSVKKTTAKMGAGLMSFFTSSMQLVTSTIAPGRDHPKSDDDVACETIQEYAVMLQQELATLEAQVETWLTKEKELSKSWSDLGSSISMIAQSEGTGRAANIDDRADSSISNGTDYIPPTLASSSSSPSSSSPSYVSFNTTSLGLGGDPELSRLLSLLGTSSDTLAILLQKKESEESIEFKEPLKDAQRTAMAVESMLKRRSDCLRDYHTLLDDLDSARAKLVTAQSTTGREGKLPQLEQAVAIAEQAAETKRYELAQMSLAVRNEFQRSQKEKAAALSQIVRTFLQLQLNHSNRVTQLWQNVLQQVGEETTSATSSSSSSS